MSVKVQHREDQRFVEVTLTGRLTKDDYREFVPELEQLIADHGKLRLMVVLQDFKGWDVGALWEDLKFDLKHSSDIQRLAVVGEKRWQEWMTVLCQPFTAAEVRYFDLTEVDDAPNWVTRDSSNNQLHMHQRSNASRNKH